MGIKASQNWGPKDPLYKKKKKKQPKSPSVQWTAQKEQNWPGEENQNSIKHRVSGD